jgi:hypothetical protein
MTISSLTKTLIQYQQSLHAKPVKSTDCPARTDFKVIGWLQKNGSGVFLGPQLA